MRIFQLLWDRKTIEQTIWNKVALKSLLLCNVRFPPRNDNLWKDRNNSLTNAGGILVIQTTVNTTTQNRKCLNNTTWARIHCYILFRCAATIPVMLRRHFSFERLLKYQNSMLYLVRRKRCHSKGLLFTLNGSLWPRPRINAGTPMKRPPAFN